ALERDRDASLDLLGGLARVERDDVDLRVGRVGEGLDRQVAVGEPAAGRDPDREDEGREPVVQRRAEEALDHREAGGGGREARTKARRSAGLRAAGAGRLKITS